MAATPEFVTHGGLPRMSTRPFCAASTASQSQVKKSWLGHRGAGGSICTERNSRIGHVVTRLISQPRNVAFGILSAAATRNAPRPAVGSTTTSGFSPSRRINSRKPHARARSVSGSHRIQLCWTLSFQTKQSLDGTSLLDGPAVLEPPLERIRNCQRYPELRRSAKNFIRQNARCDFVERKHPLRKNARTSSRFAWFSNRRSSPEVVWKSAVRSFSIKIVCWMFNRAACAAGSSDFS